MLLIDGYHRWHVDCGKMWQVLRKGKLAEADRIFRALL